MSDERWTRDSLVDRVADKTKGTEGDPLTRAEVEQVVDATLQELGDRGPLDEPDSAPET